jgi:hypothetical protein
MHQPSGETWRWTELAWRLYERAPAVVEDAAKWCAPFVLPWFALRVPVVVLRGPSPYSGRPWAIVMAGSQAASENVAHRYFSCPPQREASGAWPVWRLPSILKRMSASADLVIARVDRLSARLFFGTGYLVVPEGVGSRLTVPEGPTEASRRNESLKADLRRIRRGRFTAEISHAEADYETFYHTMYVPYMRKRHGSLAFIRNEHQMRRAFRRGGILWLQRDGQRIAGDLFQLRGGVLSALGVGTIGGDFMLMKEGVSAALYFFLIKHAREWSCPYIDFGSSPPALTDGLLRYKRKWGCQLTVQPPTRYDYLLRWERPNEQVGEFLAHRALIFRKHGRLSAVTAVGPGSVATPALARQLYHSLSIPGLQRIFVLLCNGEADPRIFARQPPGRSSTDEESKVVFCDMGHFLQDYGGVG